MNRLAWCLLLVAPFATYAADELSNLSDEFNSADSLQQWKQFHATHGWPNKVRQVDVNDSVEGALHLQPLNSAWVRDLNAPFLYKEINGDFDVRARIRVRGNDAATPTDSWALGGLFARVPTPVRKDNWEPRRENWLFITTGAAQVPGEPVTETKSTVNSASSLKLRPFVSGWVELRLVRAGNAYIAMARADGEKQWQVRDRFYRINLPPQVQVGLVAYTTSKQEPRRPENPNIINNQVDADLPVDMLMDVDYVRFQRPRVGYGNDWYRGVTENRLADYDVSNEEVLRLLGE